MAAQVLESLNQLVQRLHFDEPLNVGIHSVSPMYMKVNGIAIAEGKDGKSAHVAYYLCSMILMELQFNFSSTPQKLHGVDVWRLTNKDRTSATAINNLWMDYHHQCQIKTLLRLCILRIRSNMSSLDDASFLSLPVPSYICRLLAYRDVSEKMFEKWCQGGPMLLQANDMDTNARIFC